MESQAFIGRGWSFPVNANGVGGIAMVGGVDEVEQAMFLILATTPGERPMRPEFGCPLIDYVFAPIEPATLGQLGFEVEQALGRWEPWIIVDEVIVTPDSDAGVLLISIDYSIRDSYDRRNLVFPFYVIPNEASP